ncbi:YggN family protein [Aestuariibacter halophilus]|uniref:YggN family protein n=1 Tax=Fluctibacter halophilus TaxID=226011 RepID=A0ABS8GBE3_9ALTE|nr:DUF2884 family protein [Aestuariibacter halophilus]MCC2617862.1 YggN family protein [Aestuariibacter halophilus]
MKKLALAITLALGTGMASAHEKHDDCNVNVDGEWQIENGRMIITTEDNDRIQIDADHTVWVNGNTLALTDEQQQWVATYYDGIFRAVPEVAGLASDGIRLASEAISQVFGEMFNVDDDSVTDLTAKLDKLGDEVHYNFYAEDGSIRLTSKTFEDGDFMADQWESEFEQAIEEVVVNSMGQILVSIGTQMMFSGGDMDAFEARMENFASDIETKIEAQAEALEFRAEGLCYSLIDVDRAENKLAANVPALSGLNTLDVEDNRSL